MGQGYGERNGHAERNSHGRRRRWQAGAAVHSTVVRRDARWRPPDDGGHLTMADAWHWLLTPISGADEHVITTLMAWHGRLMVLAMGLLTPPVIMIARFFKVTARQDWPRQLDNPFWFITHRRWSHVIGVVVALALLLVLIERAWVAPWRNLHALAGWLIIVLVLVQLVGAWLRGTHGGPVDPFTRQQRPPQQWPGDHYSMTRRRIVFEYVHKIAGYLLLALTVAALLSGLIAADAPRWMPITLGVWWLAMAVVFIALQRAGRCVDTYQAIWGLDPALPGNRRRPIGFGILRASPQATGAPGKN
jgi:hypothetical protein